MNVLKNAFLDANNKPKPVPFAIMILCLLLVIFILFSGTSPGTAKQSPGVLDVEQMVPKPSQKSQINLSNEIPEADYVQRQELDNEVQKKLQEALSNNYTQKTLESDDFQNDLIKALKEERQKDLDVIRQEMDYKNEELKKELADLKKKINEQPGSNSSSGNGAISGIYPNSSGSKIILPSNSYDPNAGYDTNTSTYNPPGSTSETSISGMKIVIDNFQPRNNPVIIGSTGKLVQGVTLGEGINAGTYIPGLLKTGCISSTQPCPVLVYTTEDVKYRDKIVMPKGTSLLGIGISDFGARKIFIELQKIVLNNREIQIKAHLTNDNGTAGFCSKYIDKVMQKFIPTLLLQITAGALQALKDVSYFTSGTGLPIKMYDDSLKNAAIDGVSQGATTWSDMVLNDAKNQGAIIIVNAELKVKIFVDEKIPIEYFSRNY